MREARLAAARGGQHSLQIMSFEQAAVRRAGGFAREIDEESLRAAIQTFFPETPMGELEDIKMLLGIRGSHGHRTTRHVVIAVQISHSQPVIPEPTSGRSPFQGAGNFRRAIPRV